MQLTRHNVLYHTHYGFKIYSFILRQYCPKEIVLHLSGHKCHPTKNPFNNHKPTLHVELMNGVARHIDEDGAIPPGDALDFAGLHYNLSGDALLQALNADMYLGFEVSIKTLQSKDHLPIFSYFKSPITNIYPSKEITLVDVFDLIRGTQFSQVTSQLRFIHDPVAARKFKAGHFHYVTFSGLFKRRRDKDILQRSGLLTIDIDHIYQVKRLKEKLLKDEYFETELLFTSPSGYGLKWIIAYNMEKYDHEFYFRAVSEYLKQIYEVKVDPSGKDLSRACFLPHDPEVYIHPKYFEY